MSDNITNTAFTCDVNSILLKYHTSCNTTEDFQDLTECPIAPEFYKETESHDSNINATRLLHGLGATFFVTICTIFGAFILPCFKDREEIFGQIMLFLTSLAVSALSGAALMVLIPEGLGLDGCAQFNESHLTVCCGILMFFIIRRGLHLLTGHEDIFNTDLKVTGDAPRSRTGTVINDKKESHVLLNSEEDKIIESSPSTTSDSQVALRKRKAIDGIKSMRSVGWMTLLGDSAHNFLDGCALGATKSLK